MNALEQLKSFRRKPEVVAATIPDIGAPPDKAFLLHLLHGARDRGRVDAETAGEIHYADVPVGVGQQAHEREAGCRYSDSPGEASHERLMGSYDFAQEMRLISRVSEAIGVVCLRRFHGYIIAQVIDLVKYMIEGRIVSVRLRRRGE